MVKHAGSVFQFLEVAKPLINGVGNAQQAVLRCPESAVRCMRNKTPLMHTLSSSSCSQAPFRLFPPSSTSLHSSNIPSTAVSTSSIR